MTGFLARFVKWLRRGEPHFRLASRIIWLGGALLIPKGWEKIIPILEWALGRKDIPRFGSGADIFFVTGVVFVVIAVVFYLLVVILNRTKIEIEVTGKITLENSERLTDKQLNMILEKSLQHRIDSEIGQNPKDDES